MVGTQRTGKINVKDGDSQKVSWSSGKKGWVKDYDNDPISTVYANKDMKISHRVHGGGNSKADGNAPKTNEMPDLPED